jgi:excisionase family DNA binding protein
MSTKLMSADELAELLGVPRRTLGQWRYTGDGPAYVKVGRHVRYRREDVDQWIESRTQRSPT